MIPIITLEHIINYCGKKNYSRGKEYVDTEALYMCYEDKRFLRAFCEGLSAPSYALWVSFDVLGITHSHCSCKANILGPCKHIAAVLLTWYYKPQKFYNRQSLACNLEAKDKQELIQLIEKMIDSCKGGSTSYAIS